jgi:4-hydroxy-tetrahydrodipicolinate synthase
LRKRGEFYALTFEEKKRIFEVALEEVNGKIPVYAGTGAINTEEVVKLTEMAGSVGVDAASIITPFLLGCAMRKF